MNIYLDIDGVLRGCASPKEDIEAFLRYCLDNHQVYWLTTHCRGGINYAPRALEGILSDDLVAELATKAHATDWGAAKTEAIDFDEPFIWFDDSYFQFEEAELKKHNADDNFFWVNPRDPESAKQMLEFLKSLN